MDYCLITGATSGIGYELAKVFADHGYGLVLVSSSSEHLLESQKALQGIYNVPILIYEQDLSEYQAASAYMLNLKRMKKSMFQS